MCTATSPLQLGHGVLMVCMVGTWLRLACVRTDITQRQSQRFCLLKEPTGSAIHTLEGEMPCGTCHK